jgi:Na+/H+ antiporter NhaD/arsenite permease-like protein
MNFLILLLFALGYLAITLEHKIRINKSASALVTGVLCWTLYMVSGMEEVDTVLHGLEAHLAEIAGIVFFLLGAMVIVELVDAHDGFEIITERIRTKGKVRLLWIVGLITFFLSSILDNLTTTIVMVSLLRKVIEDREDRLFYAGIVVVAANAGGAWSPLGDVTTTMLWIGGQTTAFNMIKMLFLPSFVCLLVPLLYLGRRLKGDVRRPLAADAAPEITTGRRERNSVFAIGVASLLFVPVFKTYTHLPPFMGILLMLGVMWIVTEVIHSGKDEAERGPLSVGHALRKVDTPSILFFLGILMAVAALGSAGHLGALAALLDRTVHNPGMVVMLLGLLSAVVDNVPLVAAAQNMYSLEQFPTDHYFWEFLAYATGTGGSILVIGSAAGVAAMGMERIDFFWYFKKITWLALMGYLAGAAVFVLQFSIFMDK